jgi:hypothetical protein
MESATISCARLKQAVGVASWSRHGRSGSAAPPWTGKEPDQMRAGGDENDAAACWSWTPGRMLSCSEGATCCYMLVYLRVRKEIKPDRGRSNSLEIWMDIDR